jgi:hypothetical protein
MINIGCAEENSRYVATKENAIGVGQQAKFEII